MRRNVYLEGDLGEKFGRKFVVNADDYSEIFKCISANRPDFLPYIRKCHEDGIGFILDTEEGNIGTEDLILPATKGDITLSIAPAGAKSGIAKILAAIAIVIVIIYFPQAFGAVAEGGAFATGAGSFAAGLNAYGQMAALFAAQLALAGIQQIMAPDPAVDQDSPTNYLFSGGASNAKEGDPIPLLYGELRVPGRPISVEVIQGRGAANGYSTDNTYTDANGNIIAHHTADTAEISKSLN
jgi:predicted phage tail protein